MTLNDCVERIHGEWVVEASGDVAFSDVVASDLMSDVLVVELDEFILVTSLVSEQAVRTADIVDARAIVLANGKRPQPAFLQLAQRHSLPVVTSPLSTFGICTAIAGCSDGEGLA